MKALKKWTFCLSLLIAVSLTAVGCGSDANDRAADETKTTAARQDDNIGEDIEDGVDDAGDAVEDDVNDVEDGAENLIDDIDGDDDTGTDADRTEEENTKNQR